PTTGGREQEPRELVAPVGPVLPESPDAIEGGLERYEHAGRPEQDPQDRVQQLAPVTRDRRLEVAQQEPLTLRVVLAQRLQEHVVRLVPAEGVAREREQQRAAGIEPQQREEGEGPAEGVGLGREDQVAQQRQRPRQAAANPCEGLDHHVAIENGVKSVSLSK